MTVRFNLLDVWPLRLACDAHPVAYVPDYLANIVHDLRERNGTMPEFVASTVHPRGTAPQYRLRCRMSAPWPAGYDPFDQPELRPLIEERAPA